MTQTARHRSILTALAGGYTTADQLATLFDVSVRTIYRDMAALTEAGAPIAGEAGVGYRLAPKARVTTVDLNLELIEALTAAIGTSLRAGAGDATALAELNRCVVESLHPAVRAFITTRGQQPAA